jgi:hypothetical protein
MTPDPRTLAKPRHIPLLQGGEHQILSRPLADQGATPT